MELIACTCDGLPPHDHYVGWNVTEGSLWESDEIGRIWVDWKAVAKSLGGAQPMTADRIDTNAYREAPSGQGPLAHEWSDKPHRLVYDLCREVERLQALRLREPTNDR